jgi:putative flippase GtrA
VVAILATGVDFIVYYGLTEVFSVHYTIANIFGPICGGITGFLLGRYWAFASTEAKAISQAPRYLLVMGASMLLNYGGLALLVELLNVPHQIGKVLIAILVGVAFNFPLHRKFVFK